MIHYIDCLSGISLAKSMVVIDGRFGNGGAFELVWLGCRFTCMKKKGQQC